MAASLQLVIKVIGLNKQLEEDDPPIELNDSKKYTEIRFYEQSNHKFNIIGMVLGTLWDLFHNTDEGDCYSTLLAQVVSLLGV
ncbi:hypothetical protein PsorP6_009026 [Peronosclerospora sorghi]|uniref:Uncharacterized protein n=1 Tax=Peronosclerospora sorghi TaxID=230839 RepID=A0ACC0W0C2_9STRA|nr:hypothetical protein PsorP6_009026 [Peronosclerospora sorghi]